MSHDLATWMTAPAGFILTISIQSSALLALGLLTARLLKRAGPAIQSGVYRTTLVVVLVCPLAAWLLSATGSDGLILRLPALTFSGAAIAVPQAAGGTAPIVAGLPATPKHELPKSQPFERPSVAGGQTPAAAELRGVSSTSQRAAGVLWTQELTVAIGLLVWTIGATIFLARLLVGHLRMSRLRAMAIPAEPRALELCRELADRIGVDAPAVLRSPFLFSPCIDGTWKPAILLPDDLGENLPETFIHELAHLMRRDGLWNLIRHASVAALWVQPLLWALSRRLEAAAEEVCDDYVLQFGADRVQYAGHLLDLAGRALPPVAPAAVGMISLRSMLAQRIVRLLDTSRSFSTRAGARAGVAMLSFGAAATLIVGLIGVGSGKAETRGLAAKGGDAPAHFADNATDQAAAAQPAQAPAASDKADVPIRGRIIDLEGRPIAGVTVTAGSYLVPKSGNLSAWLEAVKQGEPPWTAAKHIDWNKKAPESAQKEATSDADGRFRLEGIGAERVVSLTLKGDRITATTIVVATREMAPFPARGFQNQHGPGVDSIYGAEFTYTATLTRPIEGVVKDAKTGEPLVGTDVRSYHFAGSDFVGTMTLRTKTDAQGRFRLTGMPKAKGNKLIIVPTDEQPYLVQEIDVPDPPGAGPVSVTAALPRGVWIEGTLTEKATAKPVPGAWLHYMPFLSNSFAQAHPSFHQHGNADNADIQDRYQTKADGSFRLVGLPGRAIVGAIVYNKPYLQGVGSESIAGMNKYGHFDTFHCPVEPGKRWPTVMQKVDPAAGATSVHLDLQVANGFSVRLKVVDSEGKPVGGASTRGLGGRSSYEREPLAAPDANISNLQADEERIVMVSLPERKIGKAIKVHKGDAANGPVVARLEPLAALEWIPYLPDAVHARPAHRAVCARVARPLRDEPAQG
jgi:beta-lactamase regulating signal transducer with metallopeptidase domain